MMAGGAFAAFQEFRERTFRLEGDVRSILGHRSLGYVPLIGPRHPTRATDLICAPGLMKDKVTATCNQHRSSVPFERVSRIVLDAPRSSFTETFRNAKLACDQMLHGNACACGRHRCRRFPMKGNQSSLPILPPFSPPAASGRC